MGKNGMTSEQAREAGRRGGNSTVAKYGIDHMRDIGRRGAWTTNQKGIPVYTPRALDFGGHDRGVK